MKQTTEYIAVPRDVMEDRRTDGVHQIINTAHRAKSLREEEEQKARRAAIDARDKQTATVLEQSAKCALGLAAIGTLVFLAHIGAIAGWVMHLSTMALTGWMGYEIGRIGGHKYV